MDGHNQCDDMGAPDAPRRRRNGQEADSIAFGSLTPPPFEPAPLEQVDDVMPVEAAHTVEPTDQNLARRVELGAPAAYMKSVVSAGLGEVGDINTMARYIDNMARQCVMDDPLQRMLLDQILLAYHRVSSLHVASSQGRSPEATVAFNSAAVKLSAELRKSMITLRELQRVPMAAGILIQKIVTVQHDCQPAESQKIRHQTGQ